LFFRDKETRIETKIIRLPGDSIFVESICPSDTIRIEKVLQTIEKTGFFEDDSFKRAMKGLSIALGFLILVFFSAGYFMKNVKKK
jgi:hypothetical protein